MKKSLSFKQFCVKAKQKLYADFGTHIAKTGR